MKLDPTRVSKSVSASEMGSLTSCMLEGDSTQLERARKIRRRALGISISLQTLFVTGLILFPLLSKGERIDLKDATPIPPYRPYGHRPVDPGPHSPHNPAPRRCCFWPQPSPITATQNPQRTDDPGDPNIPPGTPYGQVGGIPFTPGEGPKRPVTVDDPAERKTVRRVTISQLQLAILSYRVEPIYPALAKQMHREGRVELRAIISTDGSIQSLEALSGDPLFYQSALAAVRQWRYKPTILNGRPVEVDTRITVVYSQAH